MSDARTQSGRTGRQPAVLWTSALVLVALIVVQMVAGRAPADTGMVSQSGQFTVLTAPAANEDLLVVLDGRSEELFVYRTDVRNGVQLFQKLSIPQVFSEARARSLGRN